MQGYRLRILMIGLLAFSGCEQLFDKGTKEQRAAAEKKAKAGEYRSAINLYEASLDGTSASADVHYKLAVIYDEKLKNPVSAMHHFARYVEFAPNGTFANEAKAYKKEGDLKLGNRLNDGTPMTQADAVLLKNINLKLRQQLDALRHQKALERTAAAKGETAKVPLAPGAKQHVVQPGETLGSISQKYYKTKAKSQDILDANRNTLGGKTTIRPGQTLIIPRNL